MCVCSRTNPTNWHLQLEHTTTRPKTFALNMGGLPKLQYRIFYPWRGQIDSNLFHVCYYISHSYLGPSNVFVFSVFLFPCHFNRFTLFPTKLVISLAPKIFLFISHPTTLGCRDGNPAKTKKYKCSQWVEHLNQAAKIWMISKNRGTPKWMFYNGKPY